MCVRLTRRLVPRVAGLTERVITSFAAHPGLMWGTNLTEAATCEELDALLASGRAQGMEPKTLAQGANYPIRTFAMKGTERL